MLKKIEETKSEIMKFYSMEKFDFEYIPDTAFYTKMDKPSREDKIRRYTNE
jgi:hypothetical protein